MTVSRLVSPLLVLATACTAHHATPAPTTVRAHARAHPDQLTGMHARSLRDYGYPAWYAVGAYPWLYSWDPAEEHRAIAAAHPATGWQLKLEFEAACGGVPADVAARSLLDAFVFSTSPIDHGVMFWVADSVGPAEVVLAELRCHRAWLRLAPSPEGLDSPLLVDGAIWTTRATKNGIEITATARDEGAAAELGRRATIVYERAMRRSAMR